MAKVFKEAPDWPVVVENLMKEVPIAEKIYYTKEMNKGLVLSFNIPNISALIGKVMFNFLG